MANNEKDNTYDPFIGQSIYPDAHAVFAHQHQSLEEIKGHCLLIFDTNTLLAPYSVGEADLLEQSRTIFRRLTQENRLFIPAQVAREFAKHRPGKLAELYQQLSQKREQAKQIQSGKYPLLNELEAYQKMIELEKHITTSIQEYQRTIGTLLGQIQDWRWNDPVSQLYRDFFTKEVVVEVALSNEKLREDLERRKLHGIPPGFKDAGKGDKGIGDLIIWHTILELAEQHQKSVIFVSLDGKADWFHKSEKLALYPRYELIDEFRRRSSGQSLYIVKLSRFLEMYGASKKVIQDVQIGEEKTHISASRLLIQALMKKPGLGEGIKFWLDELGRSLEDVVSSSVRAPAVQGPIIDGWATSEPGPLTIVTLFFADGQQAQRAFKNRSLDD